MSNPNQVADKVLWLVRNRGPVIPSQIHKEIGTDMLFASAILAELVSKNLVKVSNVKIGSSPLYYVKGQEHKLQNYVNYLHPKEKEAYELLRQKNVLRDKDLDTVIRVALRQIKDFAVPLFTRAEGQQEIFWKWYLLPDAGAEPLVRSALNLPQPVKPEPVKQESVPEPQQVPKLQPMQQQ